MGFAWSNASGRLQAPPQNIITFELKILEDHTSENQCFKIKILSVKIRKDSEKSDRTGYLPNGKHRS